MIIKIKPSAGYYLAYKVMPGTSHFYRFSSELPINVIAMNEKNYNLHRINRTSPRVLSLDIEQTLKYKKFHIPSNFSGHSLYYFIENPHNKDITVSFSAGHEN